MGFTPSDMSFTLSDNGIHGRFPLFKVISFIGRTATSEEISSCNSLDDAPSLQAYDVEASCLKNTTILVSEWMPMGRSQNRITASFLLAGLFNTGHRVQFPGALLAKQQNGDSYARIYSDSASEL
jgi:hypothetical protein